LVLGKEGLPTISGTVPDRNKISPFLIEFSKVASIGGMHNNDVIKTGPDIRRGPKQERKGRQKYCGEQTKKIQSLLSRQYQLPERHGKYSF
jgi:hypothetical protein